MEEDIASLIVALWQDNTGRSVTCTFYSRGYLYLCLFTHIVVLYYTARYSIIYVVSQKVSKPFIQFIIKLVLEDSIIFIIKFALCMYYSGTVDHERII